MSRLHCVFQQCHCNKYKKNHSLKCGKCNHGASWHMIDQSQFKSTRLAALTPIYIYKSRLPMVPPLPLSDFCVAVIALPV